MKQFLVSRGGLVYLPDVPDGVNVSAPEAGMRFEILDVPFGWPYDQTRFVCRDSAVLLASKYPDIWTVECER